MAYVKIAQQTGNFPYLSGNKDGSANEHVTDISARKVNKKYKKSFSSLLFLVPKNKLKSFCLIQSILRLWSYNALVKQRFPFGLCLLLFGAIFPL